MKYGLAWFLGIPIPILIVVYLVSNCLERLCNFKKCPIHQRCRRAFTPRSLLSFRSTGLRRVLPVEGFVLTARMHVLEKVDHGVSALAFDLIWIVQRYVRPRPVRHFDFSNRIPSE